MPMSDAVFIMVLCILSGLVYPFLTKEPLTQEKASGYRLGMFGAAGIATAVAFWPSLLKYLNGQ